MKTVSSSLRQNETFEFEESWESCVIQKKAFFLSRTHVHS